MINLNFRSCEEYLDHMTEVVYVKKGQEVSWPKIGVISYRWAEVFEGELTGNFKDYEGEDPGSDWTVVAFMDDEFINYDISFVTLDEWNEAFKEVI